MLANNAQAYLFNYNTRLNSNSYNRDSFLYSSLSPSTSNILPSLNQLPVPNLNHNKLPPIKSTTIQVKPSFQHQQHQLRYKCTKCTKSFNRKNSLSRHERVHTGNKPYSCKICNKSFTRKDILEGHKLSAKCQRRTQFYLNNINLTISTMESYLTEEPNLKSCSLSTSLSNFPVIENTRTNPITCLLSSNNIDYYSQEISIEQQWSPLRLPSLSEIYKF